MRAALILLVATLPARADVVTPDQFDALSRGNTLYFRDGAAPFGAEQYFDGRRVRWMYADGQCVDGRWYAQGTDLCFVYDPSGAPQCWQMRREDGRITARRVEYLDETPIHVERIDTEPLACPGPDLGV